MRSNVEQPTISNSADLFLLAFENTAVGMAVMRTDGGWSMVNDAFCNLLGYERAELLELDVKTVTHPDDLADTLNLLERVSTGQISSYQLEKRYIHKNGWIVWVFLTVTLIRGANDAPVIFGQIQDISKRKRAEEALQRSEALFRTIAENAGDLIFIVNLQRLVIEYTSPTFETLLGYSHHELVGHSPFELVHAEDHPLIAKAHIEMLEPERNAAVLVLRFKNSKGQFHFVEGHGCAVPSPGGKVERIVVVARIIDDRIAAQKKLKAREQQLQLLLDSTAEGIYGLDLNGICTFCNRACLKMAGCTEESQLLGKNLLTLFHRADLNGTKDALRECSLLSVFVTGDAVHVDDEVIWRSDGTQFPVEYWSYPMREDGIIVGCVVAFVDISARKTAEREVRKAHSEAELVINSVPSILVGLDAKGRILRWNSAAGRTFALEEVDVLGKSLATCGIGWLAGDLEKKLNLLLGAEGSTKWDDMPFEKDGQRRLLGITATKVTLSDARDVMFLIVGADITERRLAEEELRFKTAFLEAQTNATLDGILVVDESRSTLLQNRRFVEMFDIPGMIREQASEQSLLNHLLPELKNPDQFIERINFIYAHENETVRDEVEFKNGMVVDRYSSFVIGKDGTRYGRLWTFRDITERKRNEEAVRRLSLAVEQSPVSIVITDLQGDITYVNRRFSESSGYSPEEVLGQNPRILKSDHTSTAEYREMWEAITHGNEWRGEFRNKKKNGELYWENVVVSPIKDHNGNPTHFLAFKQDVTEQRSMETQLRQAQKLEAIGQLAAGIAHEINTPMQFVGDNTRFVKQAWTSLAPVLPLLRSLSEPESGPSPLAEEQLRSMLQSVDCEYLCQEIPQALEQSLEGIARVTKIVQAMKEFSHPGSDEKQLADINKAILTTLTVARNEWKYVAEVETHLASDLELVPCHLGEFCQVILNLLINSAHAIAEVVGDGSQRKGQITIRTSQEKGWATITIQDSGKGIPEQIRSRIFEPFFTTKAVGSGTGQGLALAHSTIVKKHGGKLWFESEVNSGTIFHIQLPMAKTVA